MIHVSELHKDQDNRNDIKKTTFNKILEDMSRVVKRRAQMGHKECYLTVPVFTIGRPLYNVRQATKYVIHKMEKNGFTVNDQGTNTLFVSWKATSSVKPIPEENLSDDEFMFPSFANLKKSANHVRSLAKTTR